VLAEQTRDLLIQSSDLLLDQMQILECHLQQPAIDRVELCAGTQCIAQLRRGGVQALVGQSG
jgi:hypothetical protein